MMKIIEGKEQDYKEYVDINSNDDYSKACIIAVEKVGELLDKGKTCEQAEKGMYGQGLTGFMAAMVCRGIWKYHPRGEEFKIYWNKKHGGFGDENGTMSPHTSNIDDMQKEIKKWNRMFKVKKPVNIKKYDIKRYNKKKNGK